MYPTSVSSAAASAEPASSRSCAATTTLSSGSERGDQARGHGDVVHDLGLPPEERRGGIERAGHRSTTDHDELRDRPQHRHHGVVADRRVADATPEHRCRRLARFADRVGGEHRSVEDVGAIDTADDAQGSSLEQQRPELSGQLARRYEEAARHAAGGQSSDECVDVAHAQLDEAALADVAGEVGQLPVEGPGKQRSDSSASRREGHRIRRTA